MEVLGYNIGLTPEDKEIVKGYLSPYVKNYVIGKAKAVGGKIGSKVGPKIALKVVRVVDVKLQPTDREKLKFVVSKAKDILEKPEIEKQEAKAAKKKTKEQKAEIRAEKKEEKRKTKIKKLRAKGKLTFKEKVVSTGLAMAGKAILSPKI